MLGTACLSSFLLSCVLAHWRGDDGDRHFCSAAFQHGRPLCFFHVGAKHLNNSKGIAIYVQPLTMNRMTGVAVDDDGVQ
jgi:hypothetical protein